ncbi:MAG: hypothetical protein M3Q45_06250, partial [Chloroflexota bacterium]|nr:hypothetical protein [Chloroflexota bacterium]
VSVIVALLAGIVQPALGQLAPALANLLPQPKVVLAAAGTITGVVFQDYNANGARNTDGVAPNLAIDSGVGGVTVTAYDANGAQCGQTTSSTAAATLGQYSLAHNCMSATVRIEFAGLPAGYQAGPQGTSTGTSVQFVGDNATNVNFGINRPAEYCQNNPLIATSCYINPEWNPPDNRPGEPAMRAFPVSEVNDVAILPRGDLISPMAQTIFATQGQVGNVHSMVYQRSTQSLFTAAFARSSPLNYPNGLGAIYRTAWAGAPTTALFTTISPVIVGPYTVPTGFPATQVGKVGLGDIELSADEQTLYVVNLFTKALVAIPLVGNPPTAGTPVSTPMPQPSDCLAANTYPFALGRNGAKLYLGLTCGAPVASLRGYVYEYDGAAFTLKLSIPFNYARAADGTYYTPSATPVFYGRNDHGFVDWNTYNSEFDAKTQPWLVDIAFDRGDMVLGIRSRLADAYAYADPVLGGELLRACADSPDNPTVWTLENNGVCNGKSTTNPPPVIDPFTNSNRARQNSLGPGGYEYYWNDDGFEGEASQGSLVQIPGYPVVYSTQIDIFGHGSQVGVMAMSHSTGGVVTAGNVLIGAEFITPYKANGLGDLEVLCDLAPIEIGNRVWRDNDNDGIQDPGESPIQGVTVQLYQASSLVGTTTTDANGEYYFNAGNVNQNGATGIVPSTGTSGGLSAYEIRIPNFATQAPLSSLLPTSANASLDLRDSDGTVSGANVVYAIPYADLLGAGYNNHTYDFGFTLPPVGIGNLVYNDLNQDSNYDSGEGVDGVDIVLYRDNGSTAGVLDVGDTQVSTTVTTNEGLYLFSGLAPGTYIVQIPASEFGSGQPLNGLRSIPGQAGDLDWDDQLDENGGDAANPAVMGVSSTVITLSDNGEPTDTGSERGRD